MKDPEIEILCPNCETGTMGVFYEALTIPVHSMVLHRERREAIDLPTGDLRLGHCKTCDFIGNITFDEALVSYQSGYESTQRHSSVFNAFHRDLARYLVKRYDLAGKRVIEIGCGQGEFLALLCETGGCHGLGFDPAYTGAIDEVVKAPNVEVLAEEFSEKHAERIADFVCCKMTLEHIPNTAEFVRSVRRSIGSRRDCVVFFQVPSVGCILEETAFWDVYYEHCSYFSPRSLTHLFRHNGFDVMDCRVEYQDQYLMIEARPTEAVLGAAPASGSPGIGKAMEHFVEECERRRSSWRDTLRGLKARGVRTVLWGGGSKAVGFLTGLQVGPEIEFVVDINPNKQGTYLPGTGHAVAAPEFLKTHGADVILVMNPVYMDEIDEMLRGVDVKAKLVAVSDPAESLRALLGPSEQDAMAGRVR